MTVKYQEYNNLWHRHSVKQVLVHSVTEMENSKKFHDDFSEFNQLSQKFFLDGEKKWKIWYLDTKTSVVFKKCWSTWKEKLMEILVTKRTMIFRTQRTFFLLKESWLTPKFLWSMNFCKFCDGGRHFLDYALSIFKSLPSKVKICKVLYWWANFWSRKCLPPSQNYKFVFQSQNFEDLLKWKAFCGLFSMKILHFMIFFFLGIEWKNIKASRISEKFTK